MPTRQNRRASKGKPKPQTSFNNKMNRSQRKGALLAGAPSALLKDTLENQVGLTPPQVRDQKNHISQQEEQKCLHPQTCKFWNKSQCKKGKECEYAHFHFKFFHQTKIPTTNGTSQVINQQYQQQVEAGNLQVHIRQISFMSWHQVQILAKQMSAGVFQQTISLATLNKNAEHQYDKEIKNQRILDDDPSLILDQKIHAINQNYNNLFKKDIKTQQQIKSLKKRQKSNLKNNKQQQETTIKKESKMEEEIDLSTSNKPKTQEQKNFIRRTSGGQQQQQKKQKENSTPSLIDTTTIQKEIQDLPKVNSKYAIKTPSKDLTEQDLDKSLDDPAIIHEANQLFSKIAERVEPKTINELMQKATQEKKLPDDKTNSIISQQIQLGKLWSQRLVKMISIQDEHIEEIYNNTGIKSRKIRNNIKYALYISAPILYIIRLLIQKLQKKDDEKDRVTLYTYSMASLITLTIQEYLTKLGLIDDDEKMNVEDIQMLIMNTFQKGVKDAYKMNHIIQLNKDEKNPIFVVINIAKGNVSKFTKIN
ncbi:hypothetical protein ABPG72_013597 [Tetrahymena utriculariae]